MSELKVHASISNNEQMVHVEEIRRKFSARLKKALAMANIAEWGAGVFLANATGKTPKAASKWMNAETMPGRDSMQAIAKALSVNVEWLQYGIEQAMEQPASYEVRAPNTVPVISMFPEYREEEYILVDPSVEPRHNDDVVARTPEGTYTFKRLQITPDGTYLLALNVNHPERKIKIPNDSLICGVVTGSWLKRR